MTPDDIEVLLKVVVSVCLGGLIGIERELSHKPAGIRTHMFVSGAATMMVALSHIMIQEFSAANGTVQSDPVRVMEAVIVGVSFIGAGTVLKSEKGHHVYYLTTAASILFAAGIGITVGLAHYWLAVALAVLVVLINGAFGNIEQKYIRGSENYKNEEKRNIKDSE